MKKERNSSIELLKIVAIILIILSHSLPFYYIDTTHISFIDINIASLSSEKMLMVFIRFMGQIGNAIFIICTAYYLLESKKVKLKKIINMILDTTIIVLLFWLFTSRIGITFKKDVKIYSLFPTIYGEQVWFVECYLLLYLIHPLLNIIIRSLKKRELLLVNVTMILMYSVINMFYDKTFYWNELISFIELYFIVAYIKKYMKKYSNNLYFNMFNAFIFTFILYLWIIIINLIGIKIEYVNAKMLYWLNISNPFIIMIALSLFNIFKNIQLKSHIINYISSLSLFVYIITDNLFVREYIKPLLFDYYFYNTDIWTSISIVFALLFVYGFGLAILYSLTIKGITNHISIVLDKKITKIYNRKVEQKS